MGNGRILFVFCTCSHLFHISKFGTRPHVCGTEWKSKSLLSLLYAKAIIPLHNSGISLIRILPLLVINLIYSSRELLICHFYDKTIIKMISFTFLPGFYSHSHSITIFLLSFFPLSPCTPSLCNYSFHSQCISLFIALWLSSWFSPSRVISDLELADWLASLRW